MTCRDGRGWTCCRQMACKRSAVRARLAPPGQKYNSNDSAASTAGKYSNGGRVGRRRCVRIRHLPPARAAGRTPVPDAQPGWSACHLRRSPPHRSRDSCHLVTPALLEGHSCQRLLPHLQVVQLSWRSGPLPGAAPAGSAAAPREELGAPRRTGTRPCTPPVPLPRMSRNGPAAPTPHPSGHAASAGHLHAASKPKQPGKIYGTRSSGASPQPSEPCPGG